MAFLLLPFGFTYFTLLLLVPLSPRLGLVDHPGGHKAHTRATPVVGGLGIGIGVLLGLWMVEPTLRGLDYYMLASALILLLGVWDDYTHLPVWVRILAQVGIALILAAGLGVTVPSLGVFPGVGELELGALSLPFTVFATVGLMNAFNMLDGLDGLLGGVALAILGVIGTVALVGGEYPIGHLAFGVAGGVTGFWLLNFRWTGRQRARVFLGDAGSNWLGMTTAFLAIALVHGEPPATVQPATVLWILGVPVMDTFVTMSRRLARRKSPFSPDHDHLHFTLTRAGFSVRQTALTITLLAGGLGVLGVIGAWAGVSNFGLTLLWIAAFALYNSTVRHGEWLARWVQRKERQPE